MTIYGRNTNPSTTPQTERVDPRQTPNNAGGFSFLLDRWAQLDRFLILGCEGGTYYVTERKLSRDNAASLAACLAEDAIRVIDRVTFVSDQGLAHKNDPAIFALALAASHNDPKVRAYALNKLPLVARFGTDFLHFVSDVNSLRGWSAGLRRAVARWFNEKTAAEIAFQVAKYQTRDGFAMRDVLRLAHPKPKSIEHSAVYRYVVGAGEATGSKALDVVVKRGVVIEQKHLPDFLHAVELLRACAVIVGEGVPGPASTSRALANTIIVKNRIPHECVPNELKSDPNTWAAMLPSMGLTAVIRNLGKMTAVGLIKPLSVESRMVADRLVDVEQLRRARIHPMRILIALRQYATGYGLKGNLSWQPDSRVLDALDEAFYLSFQFVVPTGKNYLLGLDVSGSMGSLIANSSLTCRDASAAMALVTAKTERNWTVAGFTAEDGHAGFGRGGTAFKQLAISPRQRLDDVIKTISGIPFGSTDCSLPMVKALEQKLNVDVFVIYTDSETYAGTPHPHVALANYARAMGKPHAKLIVVGMQANPFTIAEPGNANMFDVVGFSADAPAAMNSFVMEGEDHSPKVVPAD